MDQETASTIQAIAGLLGVVISVIALYVAIKVEARNEKRFKEEQQIAQKIAIANIKPIIDVHSSTYIDNKAVRMTNYGTGTAIITDISFTKNGKTARNIVNLIALPRDIYWDTFWMFSSQKLYYLKSGDERILAKLTLENLTAQGFEEQEALSLLECWEKEKAGIHVRIVYEDVLGNEQPTYERML